ncbi:MAG TPA: T9SS type A sorting domain-containing protein [Flavobacterium sp.]|uniref:T9SS-dependent choice-of-anchor J family protein n=1 Tax=Flavobacterium sp. TaxID=239 RepID=UPI002B8941A0|nr:T9SS type A sorting domain-containing protein [Flavobacterium sp.]HSD13705.1 T9SS type A sorting domain-containing protein [Flavobacterium sp.]
MKKFTSLIYLLLFSFVSLNAQIITIGTGTSTQRFPLGNYFGYERSASIYTAAEVGSGGNIISLAWQANTAGTTRPIVIYLMETTNSTLTTDTWANQISGATQVYSGTLAPVVGWNTINLPVPFSYSGGANNLMVLVEANYGGSGGTGSAGSSVRYSDAPSQHEAWQADGSVPTGTGAVNGNRPNIQIMFGSPCSGTPVAGTVTPTLQNVCTGSTPANLVASGYTTGAIGLNFQWEESNDNGVADAWAPAVGGSGGTTTSYTPPAFSGTPIYYRLKATCTNSSLSDQSASVLVSTQVNPTIQISNVTIPANRVGYADALVNWNFGNGTRGAVFISDSPTFTDPVNGNAPALTPNTVYSGSGQQLIYDGLGTNVIVTGLSSATQYYIKAYEYIRCGSGPYDYFYNTDTGTNIGNFTTCGVYAVPASESFAAFVPGCWQRADDGNLTTGPATFGGSSWISDGFGNVGTSGAARYNIYQTGSNDWIMSPLYDIPATGYELKFDAAATQYNAATAPTTPWESDDYVEVLVSTGTRNWTVLHTFNDTNVPSHTGITKIIDLDAYAGQAVRFAFRAVEGTANGSADIDFSIDNFEIRLTPACSNPFGLNVTGITDNAASIGWSATTGNYQYVLDNVATDPAGSGTTLSGETYSASALSPNTIYYFHVRTVCAGPLYSPWSTISFTTLPTPPVNDNCNNAVALINGGVFNTNAVVGTNFAATNSNPPAPGCASYSGGDVWYSITIPASGNLTVETNSNGSALTDTGMAVYSGSCGGLTLVSCDDDSSDDGYFSKITLTGRTPGEVLYVNVWEYGGDVSGTFKISAYDASLSANSFDATSFKAYPNPVKDILNLSYSSEISSVEVYNMLGQKVMVKTLNVAQGQIDMSNLNSGNYIVKVTADGLTKSIKVVKQ